MNLTLDNLASKGPSAPLGVRNPEEGVRKRLMISEDLMKFKEHSVTLNTQQI